MPHYIPHPFYVCKGDTRQSYRELWLASKMNVARVAKRANKLRGERDAAREALKPFAAKADLYERNHPQLAKMIRTDSLQVQHRLGDFLRARAAMGDDHG
jgi:hypothetical protein